ncbi:MAG: hypothetical protein ACXWL5_03930 [Candidatus Chromulinivorax sp.]
MNQSNRSQAQFNRKGTKFDLNDDENLASTLKQENKELADVIIPKEKSQLLYDQAKNLTFYSIQAAAIAKAMQSLKQ